MLTVDWGGLYPFFLVSIRLTPAFLISPLLGVTAIPGVVKVLLSFAFSASLAGTLDLRVPVPAHGWLLLYQVGAELFLGACLAFGVYVAFGTLVFAGRILDTQMSLGLSGVINPLSQRAASPAGVLFELLGLAYLYAIDGLALLLHTFAALFDVAPLGMPVSLLYAQAAVAHFGVLMPLALSLAAPLMVTLFVVDVGVALMSRAMPQLNAFFLAMPIKVALGWLLLLLLIPHLGTFFERWFFSVIDYWIERGR